MTAVLRFHRAIIFTVALAASLHAGTVYNIQPISGPPGAQGFYFNGLNNAGTLVGQYRDGAGNTLGFIENAGAFTTVTNPSSTFTALGGINNKGEFFGSSSLGAFSLVNQTYTYYGGYTVFGASAAAYLFGINDSGTIVGSAGYAVFHAGLIIQPDSSSALLSSLPFTGFRPDVPWSLRGVNNAGDIVGEWTYVDQLNGTFITEGFLLPGSSGAPIQLAQPAQSINNLGEIVGADYIYQNGAYQTLDIANSLDTELIGVNDSGAILGYYLPSNFDPDNAYPDQYFLATPVTGTPEPPVSSLLTAGLLTLGLLRRRALFTLAPRRYLCKL